MDVATRHHEAVAVITMDDGKRNAMTPNALSDLRAALDAAIDDDAVGALVLAGRPGSFCAGFDLATMVGGDLDAIRTVAVGGAEVALRLWSCPKPLVAACTGHAFTIGAIWLCTADTRIGARGDFTIAMTETRMGVTLTPWALEPLAARLSPRHWVPAIVQSRAQDPDLAAEAGFLDEVLEPDGVVDRAIGVATDLAALPGAAYAGNKLGHRRSSIATMTDDLAVDPIHVRQYGLLETRGC